jgi:hypothetical protein
VSRRTPSRKRHRPQVRGSKYRLCRLTRHWKRKHHSAESAEVARGEMQRKYPQYDYRAYACRCGAWHVGRDVRKAREEKVMSVEGTAVGEMVIPIGIHNVRSYAEHLREPYPTLSRYLTIALDEVDRLEAREKELLQCVDYIVGVYISDCDEGSRYMRNTRTALAAHGLRLDPETLNVEVAQ